LAETLVEKCEWEIVGFIPSSVEDSFGKMGTILIRAVSDLSKKVLSLSSALSLLEKLTFDGKSQLWASSTIVITFKP
jgi:hypothetical protein